MEPIKVIHISDLHISDDLSHGDKWYDIPGRHGHNVKAFLALDAFLKTTEWDLLLITGDVSRIGESDSFVWVKDWLEGNYTIGNFTVGLNLSKSTVRKYLIVPGNHDRFGGNIWQGSLNLYNKEFPEVKAGSVESLTIRGCKVNIHLFDSTTSDGGFAGGKIEQNALVPKALKDTEIDIALLHHPFLHLPEHPRETAKDLKNSADVAAYMLYTGFDAIFFGHTHKRYIEQKSVKKLSRCLPDKRQQSSSDLRRAPKVILQMMENNTKIVNVPYRRTATKKGQLPTRKSYFDYLFFLMQGYELDDPSNYQYIREFYDQINNVPSDIRIQDMVNRAKQKEILISLAPSACQAKNTYCGFNIVTFRGFSNGQLDTSWNLVDFNGSNFQILP
jgi:3',5'-cyclic AMP phosphodiesterase CpdA